ncbi:Beta-glucosidase, GBA2 type family protein [Trifolium repens]|nr:Beta-glucosidase, GBA2 type family protein [Trifolium repens]
MVYNEHRNVDEKCEDVAEILPGKENANIKVNFDSIVLFIFVSREGGNKSFASVLAPGQHEGLGSSRKADEQGISSWGWNLNGQHSTYHALFPRAWTVYDSIFIFLVLLLYMCVSLQILVYHEVFQKI